MSYYLIEFIQTLAQEEVFGILLIGGSITFVSIIVVVMSLVESQVHKLNYLFAIIYIITAVMIPVLLLVPLILDAVQPPGFVIIVFLFYTVMLIFMTSNGFNTPPLRAFLITVLPWLTGFAASFFETTGIPGLNNNAMDTVLLSGLTAFTAFWISFPVTFIGPKVFKDFRWSFLLLAIMIFLYGSVNYILIPLWDVYFDSRPQDMTTASLSAGLLILIYVQFIENRRIYRNKF